MSLHHLRNPGTYVKGTGCSQETIFLEIVALITHLHPFFPFTGYCTTIVYSSTSRPNREKRGHMLQHFNNGEHVSCHLISCKNSPCDGTNTADKNTCRPGVKVRISRTKPEKMPNLFTNKEHTHRSITLQSFREANHLRSVSVKKV